MRNVARWLLGGGFCIAGAAAFAGKVNTWAATGIANDRLASYTYRVEVDGYPPVPHEEIIMGGDMVQAPNYRMGYYINNIEAVQHIPGQWYNWRAKRKLPNSQDLGEVVSQGASQAY